METWSSYIDGLGREGCAADPAALLRPGLELELIRQPADMGRPFSVAVLRRGVLIGYLPKPDARPVAKLIDRGGRARAFVLELRQARSFTGPRLKSIVIEIEAVNPGGEPWSDVDRAEIAGLGVDPPLAARRSSLAAQARIIGVLCAGVVAVTAWANIPEFSHEFGSGGTPEPTVAMALATRVEPAAAVEAAGPAPIPDEQMAEARMLPAPAADAVPVASQQVALAATEPGLSAPLPVGALGAAVPAGEPLSTKTQERPSSAPERVATVDAEPPAANMPLLPQAALTLPAGLAPFEVASGPNHVVVPVRNAGSLAVTSALPAAALAAPAATVPAMMAPASTAAAPAAPVQTAQVMDMIAPLPPEAPAAAVPLPMPRPDDIPTKQRRKKRR